MKPTVSLLFVFASAAFAQNPNPGIPRIENHQLIVDGKPFLMLAAEVHNSSSSSLEYMRDIWPRLAAIPLNTVLTPVSWELVEPQEGKFDFALVDGLVQDARRNHLHLVLLWLASWKNGMSSYAPVWVKSDAKRFPRVIEQGGEAVEILSPLSRTTADADARAFAALMHHLKDIDGHAHTVLMIQVENEVGVLGDSRDRSPAAEKAFAEGAPKELPDRAWDDESFMAWHYARYINHVAAAGKAEYPLPMYVNNWLANPQSHQPGKYPSGGSLPWVADVWRAAGTSIDMFSPDIYASDVGEWCRLYSQNGNPLFIPEANGGAVGAANVFLAVGRGAMGFSPFGIDSWQDKDNVLGKSYSALMELSPEILKQRAAGQITGFILDKAHPSITADLGGRKLTISLDSIFGNTAESGFGIVMATGPNEYLGAGKGFRVQFAEHIGIGYVEEGHVLESGWVAGRRLNGDENDQGGAWRFAPSSVNIEKAVVYSFE
jgi:beta-galactosidase GanA